MWVSAVRKPDEENAFQNKKLDREARKAKKSIDYYDQADLSILNADDSSECTSACAAASSFPQLDDDPETSASGDDAQDQ